MTGNINIGNANQMPDLVWKKQIRMSCSCERGPSATLPFTDYFAGTAQYLQALTALINHINGAPREEKHEPLSSDSAIKFNQLYKGGPIICSSDLQSTDE